MGASQMAHLHRIYLWRFVTCFTARDAAISFKIESVPNSSVAWVLRWRAILKSMEVISGGRFPKAWNRGGSHPFDT